jgi:hypothetical protein
MLCVWNIAATPKNIVGSFRRASVVVQWDMEHEYLMAIIMSELADRVEELLLHECVEAQTEDAITLDEALGDLKRDLE